MNVQIDRHADSRVVKAVRHLRSLKEDDGDKSPYQRQDRSLLESSEGRKKPGSRSSQQAFRRGPRQLSTPNGKKALQRTTNYVSAAQAAVLLNTLQEKAVDVMKKSTAIYGVLQKYDMNVGALCNVLFNDRLFKSAMLSQSGSIVGNSKKLEQFLLGRIDKKMSELTTSSLLEQKLNEMFAQLDSRIGYLKGLQNGYH